MDKLFSFIQKNIWKIVAVLIVLLVLRYFYRKYKAAKAEADAAKSLSQVVKNPQTGEVIDISSLASSIYAAIFWQGYLYTWSRDKQKVALAIANCKTKEIYELVKKAYSALYPKADCYAINFSTHCYQTGTIEGDYAAIFGETADLNTAINALQ